ncbi:alpha/beta fold hydrolase [Streptomyces durbertensis]|uniref:Alpha/beta fold hydrolase n=1 Tax=Streptomyces durbertensis TaxID=2448886 RepID=A0ABR6EHQ4_9ACTN|nr:alpha/beta fold hydrolase [Streptomyces durbertensis]MBB1244842.1 alpha/beta fold hydrolase [Streptomyces durbertensis]
MREPALVRAMRVTALEATVLAGHLLLYPTGLRRDAPVQVPPEGFRGPRPVLLLHGFVDNRSVFALLRLSLLRNGWQAVAGVNYSPFTTDLRAAAEALLAEVDAVRERTGHERVDVVSHSLGGLVARYAAQRLDGHRSIHTLVTLGTPHRGTDAGALLSVHPLVRQIRPGSAVLTELTQPAPGCDTRFVSFWSDHDMVMSPSGTARLDHPDLSVREVPVHGVGHLAMPSHWAVIARVRQELVDAGLDPAVRDARGDVA